MWQKVFSVASCCLLAACSNLPTGGMPPPAGAAAANVAVAEAPAIADDSLLVLETIAFAQRVASASADEQRQEMAVASKVFVHERSNAARLCYGVLLSLPGLIGADAQRAIATLEPLNAAGEGGPLRQFAGLIVLQVNQRLKEQRRAQQFKEQLDESRASERVSSERATQLKEQLDELRAIERALIERGQARK